MVQYPKNGKSPGNSATQDPEFVEKQGKRVPAIFFRTEAGGEPLREWLKSLPSPEDRRLIGDESRRISRRSNLDGPSGCRYADPSVAASAKYGRISRRTASRGCCSTLMRRGGWS